MDVGCHGSRWVRKDALQEKAHEAGFERKRGKWRQQSWDRKKRLLKRRNSVHIVPEGD